MVRPGKTKRGWGSRAAPTATASHRQQQQDGPPATRVSKAGAGGRRRAAPPPATLAERFALLEHQRKQLPKKAGGLGVTGSKVEKKRRLRNKDKRGSGKVC